MKSIIIILFFLSELIFAHGGRLNSSGCHNNRKTEGYHCHRGASKSTFNKRAVKSNCF